MLRSICSLLRWTVLEYIGAKGFQTETRVWNRTEFVLCVSVPILMLPNIILDYIRNPSTCLPHSIQCRHNNPHRIRILYTRIFGNRSSASFSPYRPGLGLLILFPRRAFAVSLHRACSLLYCFVAVVCSVTGALLGSQIETRVDFGRVSPKSVNR